MRICEDRGRGARRLRRPSRASGKAISATRACSSSAISAAPAISRCRSSATAQGRVMALGERDCSLQRLQPEGGRGSACPAAVRSRAPRTSSPPPVRLGEAANYRSAGTVEFLFDAERQEFFFLEMNTRLQVEHGVTEEVMGIDLVEWMIRGGAGRFLRSSMAQPPTPRGPCGAGAPLCRGSRRSTIARPIGALTAVSFPENVRAETWRRQHRQRLVRSDARQADRPRADARGGDRGRCRPRSTRAGSTASKQTALAARCRPQRTVRHAARSRPALLDDDRLPPAQHPA